ncbi:unnamed protein product, partial [Vitis vinifera]
MEVEGSSKKMIATQEEMVEAKVPLGYRDQCAHLLIPLNKCRHAEFYLPWNSSSPRNSPFLSFPKPPMLRIFRSFGSLELMGWVDALMFVSAIGGIHLGVFQEMTVTDSKYFLL